MKMLQANAYQSRGVADSRQGQNSTPSSLGAFKGRRQEAHTAPTKYGMGDYYGSAYKNPIGRVRAGTVGYRPVSRKQMGTPPKNVV